MFSETDISTTPVVVDTNFVFPINDTYFTEILHPPESPTDVLQLSDVITTSDEMTIDQSLLSNAESFNIQKVQEDFSQFKISDQSFLVIDLGLTQEQLNLLQNIDITQQKEYNNFGDLDSLKNDVNHFLNEISTANQEEKIQISQMIEDITHNILTVLGKETAWLALRGFTENHAFDIPRWHIDGYFNEALTGSNFEVKFGTALIGPQTLFYPLPSESRDHFYSHEDDRIELHHCYSTGDALTAKSGQGVFFVVGNMQRAAVHSEPKTESGRLFLSIVAGSHNEIRALDKRLNRIAIDDHINNHS